MDLSADDLKLLKDVYIANVQRGTPLEPARHAWPRAEMLVKKGLLTVCSQDRPGMATQVAGYRTTHAGFRAIQSKR